MEWTFKLNRKNVKGHYASCRADCGADNVGIVNKIERATMRGLPTLEGRKWE